jgi:thiazole/oxazole-forming peptide maturase SagD family component
MQFTKSTPILEGNAIDLMGSKTGLVNGLYSTLQSRGIPQASLSQPITSEVALLADSDHRLDLALGGKGEDITGSFMSSIGETVERYCLCFPPNEEDLVEATYEEVSERGRVIDYDYLDIADPDIVGEQIAPFDRDTEIYWTQGRDLVTDELVFVPAELVWIEAGPLTDVEARFLGTSNGAAAGQTLEDAVLSAIYELVERDAFMRTWARQQTPDRIPLDRFPEIEEFASERIENEYLTAHLLDYDSVLDIPAIGAVVTNDRGERPGFLIGGSAAADPVDAMRHGLVETIQGWPYLAEIAIDQDIENLDPGDPANNFDGNVLYYAMPENVGEVEFFLEGDQTDREFERRRNLTTEEEYQFCLEQLADAGFTPIAFDVTTPDVERTGIKATRVVIPELVMLTPPFTVPVNHPAFDGETVSHKPHPYP